ncbi:MAG TPA: hypothetical protein VNC16_13430 [Solirubrobacterales bacterium]|nr:hypothetical protein [Solirubrobacterales bacterium]
MEAAARLPLLRDLTDRQRARVRKRSKLFFGNQDRMEVLVAIALSPDGLVNATDLQWEIEIVQNRVRNQLVALARVGLLTKFPQRGGKAWYKRVDSSLWGAALDLYEDWTA